MDGPNIEKLFTETDCLTAQSNLDDICRYLRFFKTEGSYQPYLTKYLPKLAKPEYADAFNEFIGDLENTELAEELKKGLVTEPLVEAPTISPTEITTTTEDTVEPKKRGRKPKNS